MTDEKEDLSSEDPRSVRAAAPLHAAPAPAAPLDASEVPDPTAVSPEDTAEIDTREIESRLSGSGDPGSTQSFEPIADEPTNGDSTYDAGASTALMWGARSDVGCIRSHNEDSYLVQSPLFCVCDGMGGHAAGEVASSIAVETISKMAPSTADPESLASAVEAANSAIIEAAQNGVGKPGMGCTATAAYIDGTTLAIAHVGDSRAYLLHDGTLIRVTRDHSYVEELVDAGEITADEARVHPSRSVITRALGSDPSMYADHFQINVEEGDRLILCSDGLSSMIQDSEIESISVQSTTAQICADNLVDAALAAGGSDNVTVVAVDIVDDGKVRKAQRRHQRNAAVLIIAIVAALALIAGIAFYGVTTSYYIGVNEETGTVAVYRGVPDSILGLSFHWLEDETSIQLEDLPEDTQRRLYEGVSQSSLEEALETISSYRDQINEETDQQIEDAQAIAESAEAAEAEAEAEAESEAEETDSASEGSSDGSSTESSSESSDEGGDGQ